jgi:hypothetical protein
MNGARARANGVTSREVQREVVLKATAERMRGVGSAAARWDRARAMATMRQPRFMMDWLSQFATRLLNRDIAFIRFYS